MKGDIEKLRKKIYDLTKNSVATDADEDLLYLKTELFLSSICSSNTLHTFNDILKWLRYWRKATTLKIDKIPIKECKKWYTDDKTASIHHKSGQFFSIVGVRVYSEDREMVGWDQPILEQPEVGILGILVKRINGVFHFLMQAKEEPGNIGKVQISPTLQATRSNYLRVHGGLLPAFFEIFYEPEQRKVLYSKLQSEEGGRFLYKTNLNMLIEIETDEIKNPPKRFIYMTLFQLKKLMTHENVVNSCTRSVIACLP